MTKQVDLYERGITMTAEIIQDYKAGLPLRKIAKKYHVSHCYVYRFLDKDTRRGGGRKIANCQEQIISDYLKGEKTEVIAFRYGVSRQSVYNVIKGNNVPMRKGRPRKVKENE